MSNEAPIPGLSTEIKAERIPEELPEPPPVSEEAPEPETKNKPRIVTDTMRSKKAERISGAAAGISGETILSQMEALADSPAAENGYGPGPRLYVDIKGVKYNVAPYNFDNAEEASIALDQIPTLFFAMVLVRPSEPMNTITLQELTDMMNLISKDPVTPEQVKIMGANLFKSIADAPDVRQAMTDTIIYSFERHADDEGYTLDPETEEGRRNRENIRKHLDIYTYPELLRLVYLKNMGHFARYLDF